MRLKESRPAKQDRGHGTRQFPKPTNGTQAGPPQAGETQKARLPHYILFLLFIIQFTLVWLQVWLPSLTRSFGHWPETLFLITATATTLTSLARELPVQNVLLAGGLIGLAALGLESLNAATGVPFGSIYFLPPAGPLLFHALPWWMPLLWVLILLTARGVARWLLAPAQKNPNYGFYVLGLAALLVAACDLSFQPFAVQTSHYWKWISEPFVGGAPWPAVLGRGLAALITLGLVTPVLINKRAKPQYPIAFPLVLWFLLLLFLLTASAKNRIWSIFGITLVQIIVLAALAGHRLYGERTGAKQPNPARP